MPIRLRLMGRPLVEITSDGSDNWTPVNLPLGKPLALLVYLVDHGTSSRDHLAEVLWSTRERAKGRASVRQALWYLRQQLGDEVFESDEPVKLTKGSIATDVDTLLARLEGEVSPDELKLQIGTPLDGLTVADAPLWRNWAEDYRSRVSHRMSSRLLSAADAATAQGRAEDSEHFLRMAIQLRPERTESHLALVSHLLDRLALDAAEEALDEVRRLGDPGIDGQLAAWEQRLAQLRRSRMTHRVDLHTDFVGRSKEVAGLLGLLRRVEEGWGQIGLVLGPAGIGKTRLLDEVAMMAQIEGARVVRVKAHVAEQSIRYGALVDVIQELLGLPGAAGVSAASDAVLRGFLPSLQGNGVGIAGPAVQETAVADAFLDLVDAVSSEAPMILLVDDLHWADEGTRAVLGRAARGITKVATLLVMASRLSQDPSLLRMLDATGELPHGVRWELAPLSLADVTELLGVQVEFEDPKNLPWLSEELVRVSQGNPLFLVESLVVLQERGHLKVDDEGRWRFGRMDESRSLDLPPVLRDRLLARLAELSEDEKRLVGRLVSVGRPESVSGLMPDGDPREIEATVGSLVAGGILAFAGERGTLDFAHDEIRDAARQIHSGRSDRRRWGGWAMAAAVVALVVAAWGPLREGGGNGDVGPKYGGGTVWIRSEAVAERWGLSPVSGTWVALSSDSVNASRTEHLPGPDGETLVYRSTMPLNRGPDVVRIHPGGREAVVFEHAGDVVLLDQSPDGRQLLFSLGVDRPDGRFHRTVWTTGIDGEDRREILRRAGSVTQARWSPDGTRIAGRIEGVPDTLFIATPAGRVLSTYPMEGFRYVRWCGDQLVVAFESGSAVATRLFDLTTAQFGEWLAPEQDVRGFECAPDGKAILFSGVADESLAVGVWDRESASHPEVLRTLDRAHRISWIRDHPAPMARRLSISDPPAEVALGGSAVFRTQVEIGEFRDPDQGTVSWFSSDPSVASVEDGTVVGNRPGSATIVAEYRDWLRDSVTVSVVGELPEAALISDDFVHLDPQRWRIVGSPAPYPDRDEMGGPLLRIDGDGIWSDGIFSRRPVTLSAGVTVEMEVRLPINRVDRQSIRVCLLRAPLVYDEQKVSSTRPRVCLWYPDRELTRFERNTGSITIGGVEQRMSSEDPLLGSDAWVHLALQLRPDGRVSVYLNRRLWGEGAIRATHDESDQWHVLINGRSVDTNLAIRRFVMWPGTRFTH